MRRRIVLSCFIGVFPAAALAADPPVIPTVVVVGEAPANAFESSNDASGFVEVIDASSAWRGTTTVGELLEGAAGVHIRRLGGREDFSTVSVRGASGGQVKILLDGVNLTRASASIVNLADLPVDSIERIEVFRGFVPITYGSGGASSVINVVSRRPTGRELSGAVSYGSFHSFKAFSSAAFGDAGKHSSATVTYRSTDGDFRFEDRGDRGDPSDDKGSKRINNDADAVDLLLRHVRDIAPNLSLTLSQSTLYKEEGTPGRGSVQASRARFERLRSISSLALDRSGGTHAEIAVTVGDETIKDPKSVGAGGIIDGLGLPYERSDSTSVSTDALATRRFYVGRNHVLEASLEASYEYYRQSFSSSLASLPKRDQGRYRLALAVGDEISIPGFALSISPQLRHERLWNRFDVDDTVPPLPPGSNASGDDQSTDLRLGTRWDIGWGLSLKGNIGTFFRPPTFPELFGSDGFSVGNPGLGPEEGVNRDIGFLWTKTRLRHFREIALEYAYFNNDVDDVIVWLPSGARIPRAQNVGKSRTTGHETRLRTRSEQGWRIDASYTHQDAENRSEIRDEKGKNLPSLPRDELHVGVAWQSPHWTLGYVLGYRSEVFLDRFQSAAARVPGYTTHDVSLDFTLGTSGLHARIEADNVTDEQHEDVRGFPVPGRAFYVTLSYAPAPDDSGK